MYDAPSSKPSAGHLGKTKTAEATREALGKRGGAPAPAKRPEPAPRRRADVEAMSDNEKYYYYLERNARRLKADEPDPALPHT